MGQLLHRELVAVARHQDPAHDGSGRVPLSPDLTEDTAVGDRQRLLLVITLAERGGAQTYVASLVPALVPLFDVTVAAHGPGPLRDLCESAGSRYVPLRHVRRPLNPWRDALGLAEIVLLCRRLRPAIVHANSSKAGVLARLAAAIARVPIRIFTVHGWAFSAHSGLLSDVYRLSDRLVARLTTLTICVAESERVAGLAARTCSEERTVVIHNGVAVGKSPPARQAGAPPAIMSVGRLQSPKDFPTLLAALALLAPGSFRAIVVGDGPERARLERDLELLGLVSEVDLLGERDGVPLLLADADIFALASASEGMPLSVLEAMAAGLPVVASAVGGVPEAVVDGETGFLVPAGDVAAFASALGRLVESPDLRRRMGAAGRARVERAFDLEECRRAHVDLYGKLLAGPMTRSSPGPGLDSVRNRCA
jgi:glycosyltransferase involved in cell wall biosynthesis